MFVKSKIWLDKKKAFICIVTAIFLSLFVYSMLAESVVGFKPEDAGLGLNTKSKIAFYKGRQISAIGASSLKLKNSFHHFRTRKKTIVFSLGGSQLHGINNFKEGDGLSVSYENLYAKTDNSDLLFLQWSQPNANLYEIYLVYLTLREANMVPDWLVIPIVYDDLRETGISYDLVETIPPISKEDIKIAGEGLRQLQKTIVAQKQGKSNSDPIERIKVNKTPQQYFENLLVKQMEERFELFKLRGLLRAKLVVLYKTSIARLVVSLTPDYRIARVPDQLKKRNNDALESLIRLAKHDGVKILVYKQPHRPGEKNFYHDRKAYDDYFGELERMCLKLNVHYRDFETIVPARYWGLTNHYRPDVFHFQNQGHEILGRVLYDFFKETTIKNAF